MTMQIRTPRLDRLGRISYRQDDYTEYLCGMKFTNYEGHTDCVSYWTTNKDLAITAFDLCKVWGPLVNMYNANPNTLIETIVGCKSDKEYCRPWRMYLTTNTGQIQVYLTCEGLSFAEDMLDSVTPEWLSQTNRPVLKVTTPWDWAFKVGTLYPAGTPLRGGSSITPAPNWKDLRMPPFKEGCGICPSVLDHYFKVGTMCKEGTGIEQLRDYMSDLFQEEVYGLHVPEHVSNPEPVTRNAAVLSML